MRTIGFVIIAVLVVVSLVVWLRGRARPPVDGDLAVIQQLQDAGSDLTKPHLIEFFLYFPNEQAAHNAAARVRSAGFDSKVQLGADNKNWLCLAMKSMVPSPEALVGIRTQFVELASQLGGEYDGWGTPIVQ
jgi:regulator of RNase E activity RraB